MVLVGRGRGHARRRPEQAVGQDGEHAQRSNRLHMTYVPVDIPTIRAVDEARARGRRGTKTGQKLQLGSAKKLQPK
jgi:hypothetical protein